MRMLLRLLAMTHLLTRSFAATSLLIALCASSSPEARAEGTRMRLMAANLTMEATQSYGPNGIRIFRGLKPDVVMIQEYRYARGTDQDMREFVDKAFGQEFHSHGHDQSGNDGLLPNGIVSRWPFKETGQWEDADVTNRDFTWACIDVPGPVDLYAVSVHLKAGGEAGVRHRQATAITAAIRKKVPAGAWVVIGGDFNTKNREEDCVKQLGEVVRVGPNFPVDPGGNQNTNANRNKPYDWVLVDASLHALETPVLLPDLKPFATGLVFDSATFPTLPSVAPVEVEDSHALGMQHMAVVRDFLLPGETAR